MIEQAALASISSVRWPTHSVHSGKRSIWRIIEIVAASAAIAMIVLSAATPSDDDFENETVNAYASDEFGPRPPPFTATHENVIGAYLGVPYTYPSDFHLRREATQQTPLRDMTIRNVDWFTDPFKNPLYYGVRVLHWRPGGRFGSMIDFTHSKAFAPKDKEFDAKGSLDGKPLPDKIKVGDYFNMLSFSHGHNMLTLNGLLRLAHLGFVWPYVGIGGGASLPHTEIDLKLDPTRTYQYEYAGLNFQALFGLEFRLPTGSAFLEYKFSFANYDVPLTEKNGTILPVDLWNQFKLWWSGTAPAGGHAQTELTSHQFIGGYYVRFVPKTVAN